MSDTIDYGNLMHDAMRSLISKVLTDVGRDGLPGAHHFFITLDTTDPLVGIPDWLKEQYPEEITIVIQHWFDNLIVEEDGFHITLNFGDTPVPLYFPFSTLRTFVDPSVEFGLRFEEQNPHAEDAPLSLVQEGDDTTEADNDGGDDSPDSPPTHDADIVSLDQFRK